MEPNAPSRGHLRTKVRLIEGTRRGLVILCAAICLLGQAERGEASNRETPLVRAIKRVRPSVVNIHSQKTVSASDAGQSGRMSGMGTGVVVDERGYIVTNYHVIEDVSSIRVTLVDGSTYPADVVARDPETDLALLHIDAAGILPVMPFGRSDDLMHGETVVAIGNAFGYEHTITQGIISELHRDVRLSATQAYRDLIQTDASINPGNSGGPLVDLEANVLGINTMIVGRGAGIGFAVPSTLVKRVAEQILKTGRVQRAWIGVGIQDLTPELAGALKVDPRAGVLVNSVNDNGPAAKSNLKPGDVIAAVAGKKVTDGRELVREVIAHDVGNTVQLEIIRDGKRYGTSMQLTARPEPAVAPLPVQQQGVPQAGLGLSVRDLSPQQSAQLGLPAKPLPIITSISPGSAAERAGLKPGDVVVEADGTTDPTAAQLADAAKDGQVLVRVRRRDATFYAAMKK